MTIRVREKFKEEVIKARFREVSVEDAQQKIIKFLESKWDAPQTAYMIARKVDLPTYRVRQLLKEMNMIQRFSRGKWQLKRGWFYEQKWPAEPRFVALHEPINKLKQILEAENHEVEYIRLIFPQLDDVTYETIQHHINKKFDMCVDALEDNDITLFPRKNVDLLQVVEEITSRFQIKQIEVGRIFKISVEKYEPLTKEER